MGHYYETKRKKLKALERVRVTMVKLFYDGLVTSKDYEMVFRMLERYAKKLK